MIGRTVSRFRIEAKLGEGGMGVVYRATDSGLNRSVAIKFLSAEAGDEKQRRRFQQEAQAASALNHPHILTVYEAGTIEGRQYLVTELIDGGTLREWMRREQPSVRQIVELAAGIADALACAHEAGIIHRDVKPENIMLSRNGYAKLVDFGLAKLAERPSAPGDETKDSSVAVTRPGMVMGTVAYMSPEQASGRPVDARSDIFSFAAVLYELLAGCRAFSGKTDVDVLHAILHAEPRPLADLRPDAPYEIRLIVEKALEKEPGDRYQSMREMTVDLKRLLSRKTVPMSGPAPAKSEWSGGRYRTGAIVAALVVLALAGWWALRAELFWRNPLAGARFTRITDFEGAELDAAISQDGKFVAFLSDRDGPIDAWMTHLGTGEFLNLTKGRFPELLHQEVPSVGFSGDGAHVWLRVTEADAFGQVTRRGVWLVPTMGGVPRVFLESAVTASWSPDRSRIVYHEPTDGDPMFITDPNGNNSRRIFADKVGHHCHYPAWSPDGRFIYFVRGIWPVHQTDIWRISAEGGEPEQITRHNSRVTYPTLLDDRTLLYTAVAEDGSGPWLYSIDVERRVSHRISFGLEQYTSIAASADGRRLAATVANPTSGLWSVPITDGIADETLAKRVELPTVRALAPRWGADYLLFLSARGGADGVWKLKEGAATELWKGSDGSVSAPADISPDGRQICFSVVKEGRATLYLMTADGTGARALAPSLNIQGAASWSPDGQWILAAAEVGQDNRVFKIPVAGGAPVQLTGENSANPLWSPDGRRIVYSGPFTGGVTELKAMTPDQRPIALPDIRLIATGHRYRFLPKGDGLVVMLGPARRQNLWLLDFGNGRLRQLTNLNATFLIQSFDVSPDGRQIIFDRSRENSDIVLVER